MERRRTILVRNLVFKICTLLSVFIRIAWAIGGNLKLRESISILPSLPRLPAMEWRNLI